VSVNALIRDSSNGERYKLQDRMVNLSAQYPGYTMTQLSWLAAGGDVDVNGFCQPASAFNLALAFFNAKRRGSEIARDAGDDSGRRPNAKLLYGKALRNPYDFGGGGVYPIKTTATPNYQPVVINKSALGELPKTDAAAAIGEMLADF